MYTYFANFAYTLMLFAFVTRDMLRLRTLLVVGQSILSVYAWHNGLPVVTAWNALFVTINATMAVQVLRERRAVRVPESLRDLHDRHFTALTPQEFLRWWSQGTRESVYDAPLTRRGEFPPFLYFLLDGTARVSRDHETVVDLTAGYFVGEMSLMTGKPASADVQAVGEVEVIKWPAADLRRLRETSPATWAKIQAVIGSDLVEKVRVWEIRHTFGG